MAMIPQLDEPNEQTAHGGLTGPLPALIAGQAARTPESVAVVDGRGGLGYAELVSRANRLSRFLRARGVGPDALIGVCMHRGVDLAVVLLGIWRAGAAYVPLDPGHPAERLSWIVRDTGVSTVLTQEALAGTVREAGAHAVCVDACWEEIATLPDTAPDVRIAAGQAAYAIYTSGSTGRPKGVLINHAGIANRVLWTVREHRLSTVDRVLHKTSLSFDAACWEVFAPLVAGGTVVMAPVGAERDAAAMVEAVAGHEVTVLQVVPSVLRLLVEEPGWRDCGSLRLLFSAGEPLHAELCRRAMAGLDVEVWNTYGPTECSIDVTATRVDPRQSAGPVPIGRPIDNLRVLVLDPDGEPVPIGVPGELYAGGVGLARGYLGRPGLTAERFVPDPYGRPGARLYRTGDVVRWRADGALDYLGRGDHQVKVNGVRIEPGEVEAALAAHPDVRAAAVSTFSAADGNKRLVAYLVCGREPTPGEIRTFLRERLPEALIPSAFTMLGEMPLTASGKVDRSALPAPDPFDDRPEHVPPRTDEERTVAAAWSELLGTDRIGVHDDFFQLGGSSLLLAQLANRLRGGPGGEGGGEVALAELFTASTVEEQARLLTAGHTVAPVRPIPRDGALPLSFGQRRQWFLDRLRPGDPEWVVPMFLRLPGDVGTGTVRAALTALQARHEVLRTHYPVVEGEPVGVLAEPGAVELTVLGAQPTDPAGPIGDHLARGFDLANGPVWRALLVPVSDSERLLLVTIHHIACDGWSAVVLDRELRELCANPGEGVALPDLPVQYADFAAWQRERVSGEVLDRELDHWRRALDGLTPLELPTDRPRPAERDARGALVAFTIPPRLANALTELGRRSGATPFMTLLAAFGVLLSRYTGQRDIAIGAPVAGRTRPEVEDVVGFFLNFLVLRCDLSGGPSFTALLDRVRELARSAFAHQHLPFEYLVEELQPDRDLSRTPLYQVAFDLHDEGITGRDADIAELDRFASAWRVAKTDLSMLLQRTADGRFTGYLEYATALFDHATIERMAQHFLRLLEALVADPGAQVSTVDFLAPEEKALLSGRLEAKDPSEQGEQRQDGTPTTVQEAFEQWAERTPDATAVTFEGESLRYRELNARANQLAHHLRERGAGPESLVGVCLERGVDLVPALLGVLKAGAAYLPLDPGQPADRLRFIATDAGAEVLVTQSSQAALLTGIDAEQVVLDDEARRADIASAPETNPEPAAGRDNLVYVIYTSGSTGRPKGGCLTHRNVLRLFTATAQHFRFEPGDVWTLFHSYAFDFSVWEIWGALLHGGRVVVVPHAITRSPSEYVDLLVDEQVTVLNQTPSAFRSLVRLADGEDPRLRRTSLRAVVFGGEKLEIADLRSWVDTFGTDLPELINMYGITETTVHVTHHRITKDDFRRPAGNPIGAPLPDLRVHLLDELGQLVPTGVAGEIHVGGAGVARGYLNRPALTAERFVPDPFGAPGSRLYRSGDLGRRRADGSLEFLGRIDHQVKIRGYRIELGEIEATLTAHPSVREAAVVLREDEPGDQRLVGYVVSGATAPQPAALRDFLAERLPDYMIPAAFVAVPAIPLTANGKLDRRALPVPAGSARSSGTYLAPRTPTEARLVAVCAEVLGIEQVGVRDSFFALGGNSLLAVRLAALIQEEFDVDLPVRLVFERPTVARLAVAVEDRVRDEIAGLSDSEVLAAVPTATKEQEA